MFSQLIFNLFLAERAPYQNDLASHSPSASVRNAISSVIVRCSKDSFYYLLEHSMILRIPSILRKLVVF
jgi:hypothetical protein